MRFITLCFLVFCLIGAPSCGGAHTSVPEESDSDGDIDVDSDADVDDSLDADADEEERRDSDVEGRDADCEVDCHPFVWDGPEPCDPDCLDHECGPDPICWDVSCGECDEGSYCGQDGLCRENGCPEGMIPVPDLDLCIDRYEASEGEAGAARSAPGVLPWVDVDWYTARLACELAGKRLCTEDEWISVCEGPEGWTYPYGDSYNPERCNTYHHGVRAPMPSGHLESCEGGYQGVFDMGGNVHEWTSDCSDIACSFNGPSYDLYYGDVVDECGVRDMGGSISPGRTSWGDLGFRCCRDL